MKVANLNFEVFRLTFENFTRLTAVKWECAAGWGRIFTTGVTMMGSIFRIELLEWGRIFPDFLG